MLSRHLLLRSALFALLTAATFTGCSENGDEGASLQQSSGTDATDGADGTDGTTSTDGTNGTDGTDGTSGVDGTSGTDGLTGTDGTNGTDGTDGVMTCGNGVCDAGETAASCPADCDAPLTCLEESCGEPLDNCENTPGCIGVFECLLECTTPQCAQQCAQGNPPNVLQVVQSLAQCGQQSGCFNPGPECGNQVCEQGETAQSCPADCGDTPSCGDGVCGPNENQASCPADCSDPLTCLETECADSYSACFSNAACSGLLQCVQTCQSDQCAQQCVQQFGQEAALLLQNLIGCGQQQGCFDQGPECGNGQCEQGETQQNCPQDCAVVNGSCEGKCNTPFQENAPCQCDPECAQFNDCCADYEQLCVEQPECGNGVCETGESNANCPADCDQNPFDPCLQESCPQIYQACYATACGGIWECVVQCGNSQNCQQGCFAGAGQQAQQQVFQLYQCGQAEGCFEQGAECGNGQCEDGENQANCPADCGGLTPIQQCLSEGCPLLFDSCAASDACASLGACLEQCSSQFCQNQCFSQYPEQTQSLMSGLLQCGSDVGCFDGGPVCGNGQCEDGENSQNCPADCGGVNNSCEGKCGTPFQQGAACQCDTECLQFNDCCEDFESLCVEPPECGNGVCESGEVETCPADCGGFDCIVNSCNIGNCLNFGGCTAALQCMGACDGEDCASACVEDAPGGAQDLLSNVLECAVQNQCLEGTEPVCGNALCEAGEADTCPEDCAVTGLECIVNGCNVGNCLNFGSCSTGLQCMGECNDSSCAQQCLANLPGNVQGFLSGVLQCAEDIGCLDAGVQCGNMVCEPGETSESCPVDCGPATECGNKLCEDGESTQTCPEDCPAGPVCGNNQCEAGESPLSCPADCGQIDPAACVYQNCNTEVGSCTGDFSCTLGLQCMADCNGDASCAAGCADDLSDNSASLLLTVVECGMANQCLE